jgi:O-antigen/teichoic acid export membrane protein
MGVICNLPIIILIVCGELFFSLWQPTQDATQLQILSILTCGTLIISGGINCIYNIFTVVNKLKLNAFAVILTGVFNTFLVFLLLKTTNLGIYAVAGVSTCLSIIRNLVFTAPYGARCLNQKWYIFYPSIARPVIFVLISTFICFIFKMFLPFSDWGGLFLLAVISCVVSVILGYFVILNKNDRKVILSKVRRKDVK